MMNSFSSGTLGGMWILHILFDLVFFIGLVLFIVWFVQFLLKKKQLLIWAIALLIVGLLGMLLTFQWNMFRGPGLYQHMFDEEHAEFNSPEEFREYMLEEMEEHMGF